MEKLNDNEKKEIKEDVKVAFTSALNNKDKVNPLNQEEIDKLMKEQRNRIRNQKTIVPLIITLAILSIILIRFVFYLSGGH